MKYTLGLITWLHGQFTYVFAFLLLMFIKNNSFSLVGASTDRSKMSIGVYNQEILDAFVKLLQVIEREKTGASA